MEQNSIIALIFVPFSGFWVCILFEWKPVSALNGNTLKVVEWLLGYTVQVITTATLILSVLAFLLSLTAFFGYAYFSSQGMIAWYFAAFFMLITIEGVAIFLAKLFLMKGKSEKLIQ